MSTKSAMSKGFRISAGDYKRAMKNGAKSIIAPNIRRNVIKAEVAEIAPNEYWLCYTERQT